MQMKKSGYKVIIIDGMTLVNSASSPKQIK